MRRMVSTQISYVLLVVGVVLVELLVLALVLPSLMRMTGSAPLHVSEVSEPPVRGYYSIVPYRHGFNAVPSIYIVVYNPSPVTQDVYIIAETSVRGDSATLVFLLNDVGISWYEPIPPLVQLDVGGRRVTAMRLHPGAHASIRASTAGGIVPRAVFACTRTGCFRLQEVPPLQQPVDLGTPWLLRPRRFVNGSIYQSWSWRAVTYTVTRQCCAGSACTSIAWCCEPCPPGTSPTSSVGATRQCGNISTGTLTLTSLALGFPPHVFVGFFTTDPSFSFAVSRKNVSAGGTTHTIYGFNSSALSDYYNPVVEFWRNYHNQECLDREIVIYGRITADPDGRQPLSTIFHNATGLYIFVATRGFREQSSLYQGSFRNDAVNITIYGVSRTGAVTGVAHLVATPTTTYTEQIYVVPANLADIVEIRIVVTYRMSGEKANCNTACGFSYFRHVRLAFYIELIPVP